LKQLGLKLALIGFVLALIGFVFGFIGFELALFFGPRQRGNIL
jgi:hypothetical protein